VECLEAQKSRAVLDGLESNQQGLPGEMELMMPENLSMLPCQGITKNDRAIPGIGGDAKERQCESKDIKPELPPAQVYIDYRKEQEDASRPCEACQKSKDTCKPEATMTELAEAQKRQAEEKRLVVGRNEKEAAWKDREIEHGPSGTLLSMIFTDQLIERKECDEIGGIGNEKPCYKRAMCEECASSLQEREERKECHKRDMRRIAMRGYRRVVPCVPTVPRGTEGMQRQGSGTEICQGEQGRKECEQCKRNMSRQVDGQYLLKGGEPLGSCGRLRERFALRGRGPCDIDDWHGWTLLWMGIFIHRNVLAAQS